MKKEYNFIDIAKFVLAIGIVAIHSNVFDATNNIAIYIIYKGITRLGVPFFFVASGFFLYNKLSNAKSDNIVIGEYIKRLLIPFFFWILIDFFPLKFIPFMLLKGNAFMFALKTIRNLIFYPWGAMWYISALIVAVLVIVCFYKKIKLRNIVIIGSILYLFALLCNNYYFLIENTFIQNVVDLYLKIAISSRNGIFEGLFFVSVGMYISELKKIGKINFKLTNTIFSISYVLLIIEILLIKNYNYKDDGSLYLMFLLLITSMFTFLLQFKTKFDTTKLRNYSTGLYFMHYFIIGNLNVIESLLNISIGHIYIFIIVLFMSLVLLTILYKMNNKYINMVIK